MTKGRVNYAALRLHTLPTCCAVRVHAATDIKKAGQMTGFFANSNALVTRLRAVIWPQRLPQRQALQLLLLLPVP